MNLKKAAAITCTILAHLAFLGSFLYLVGFVGNFIVPKTIDGGTPAPFWESVLINFSLILMFGLQHSLMARQRFKQKITTYIPPHFERSVFVLLTGLALGLLYWLWQPMPTEMWTVETGWVRGLLWGIFGLGWILVLISAGLISRAHLVGRQQIIDYLKGWEPSAPDFQVPGLYKLTRHPMMLGFVLAFWSTPTMTAGHLIFTCGMTIYILVALPIEERDMVRFFGERYRIYKKRVPMLLPFPKRQQSTQTE